jgi:hypothetical protein
MKFGNEFWLILFREHISPKLFAVHQLTCGRIRNFCPVFRRTIPGWTPRACRRTSGLYTTPWSARGGTASRSGIQEIFKKYSREFFTRVATVLAKDQCWGYGYGSAGSSCFWASRIRIHLSEVRIRLRLRIHPFFS